MRISKKAVLLSALMLMLAAPGVYAAASATVSLDGKSHTASGAKYYKDDINVSYAAESDANIKSIMLKVDGKEIGEKEGAGLSASGSFTIEKGWLSANETKD